MNIDDRHALPVAPKFGKARGDSKMPKAAKISKWGHSITLNFKHTVYKIGYKNLTLFIP